VRVDDHTIEVAGAPVFFRSAASSGVPALYLHGVPTSSDDWIGLLERTGGIAPDLIGFGRSAKAGNLDYTIDGLADFVERFLDAVNVSTIRLVAHDWGAVAGLVFAQRRPERIERLALINAVPVLAGFEWHRLARVWRRRGIGELAMGATTRWLLARALRQGTVKPDAWSDERLTAVWQQFDQGTQRAILRLYRDADSERLAAAGTGLAKLDVPALILWGASDPWLGTSWAAAYGAALPQAHVQLVDAAGHWPWLDRPGVTDELAAFLE
jgi:pimeloyl-ACP methyl ester carboxylesterase